VPLTTAEKHAPVGPISQGETVRKFRGVVGACPTLCCNRRDDVEGVDPADLNYDEQGEAFVRSSWQPAVR
jgi:hypothetical protein